MPMDREQIVARLEAGERDLSGLDLAGADLSRLDLRGVNLSRADMSSADLRWAVLEGADLSSSVLRQADARWAILRGANLRQADVRRANLAWSDLSGTDLLGADLDGAVLDNASLGDEPPRRGRAVRRRQEGPSALSRLSVRELSPTVLLLLGLGALLVIQGWGWLYRTFYFDTFFTAGSVTAPPDLVTFFDGANLVAGVVNVVLRSALAAVTLPVLVLALALVVLAFLAVPLLLLYLGERLLGDVIRPAWRPVVAVGLFIAYFAVFILAFPVAAFANQWVRGEGLPKGPILGDLVQLFRVGGLVAQLGLLLVVAAAVYLGWLGWRLLSYYLATHEFPTAWRLRYPALNDALVRARQSRFFARNEPLTADERRRGLMALGGGLLLLTTLMTGVGTVDAYGDMCDGGRLPRVQLYVSRAPAVPDDQICQRLLVTSEGNYYVFFPNQTTQRNPEDVATRVVNLKVIGTEGVDVLQATGRANSCATCLNEPGRVTGNEWFIYDPNLVETQGIVQSVAGPGAFTLQPDDPTMPGIVQLVSGGIVTINGLPAGPEAIVPEAQVAARGNLAGDGTTLEALVVNVVQGSPAPVTPGPGGEPGGVTTPVPAAQLSASLTDPMTAVVDGSAWQAGNQVVLGVGSKSDPKPAVRTPLPGGVVTVGPDGTFSAPIQYDPQMPTGPDFLLVAQDATSGQVAATNWPWLAPPAPTSVPPTSPPQETQEVPTPAPATATVPVTNTPFPTGKPPGWVAPSDCDPDEFEYDNTRPWQKEIYVGVGDANGVEHNFCPKGDVDLMYFTVKQGRSYKVETSGLAQGVDTVMAVGDLSNSTPCEPAGCWNDDAAALTFASLIEFTAVEDDVALITVSNRGSNFSTEATYELTVVEFVPTPTPTVTPLPSGTVTATPTATRTPPPFLDLCEVLTGISNDTCARACPGLPQLGVPYAGTLFKSGDNDWFLPNTLPAGTYKLSLTSPEDKSYALILHDAKNPATNNCPIYNGMIAAGGTEGDTKSLEWTITSSQQFAIEVTSFRGDYYDIYNPYLLLLERIGDAPTSTTGPSPTPTETHHAGAAHHHAHAAVPAAAAQRDADTGGGAGRPGPAVEPESAVRWRRFSCRMGLAALWGGLLLLGLGRAAEAAGLGQVGEACSAPGWQRIATGADTAPVWAVAVSGENELALAGMPQVTDAGHSLYRGRPQDLSWTGVPDLQGVPVAATAIALGPARDIWVGGIGQLGNAYLSQDGGRSFTTLQSPVELRGATSMVMSGGVDGVVAAAYKGSDPSDPPVVMRWDGAGWGAFGDLSGVNASGPRMLWDVAWGRDGRGWLSVDTRGLWRLDDPVSGAWQQVGDDSLNASTVLSILTDDQSFNRVFVGFGPSFCQAWRATTNTACGFRWTTAIAGRWPRSPRWTWCRRWP